MDQQESPKCKQYEGETPKDVRAPTTSPAQKDSATTTANDK